MVSTLGLTGVPFINVANGCATGGSALISAYNAINAGAADVVMALGFDKHPRGAFDPEPGRLGPRPVVRRQRPDAHDAVLRHEDPALHARARDLVEHAGQGRGQGLPQRVAQRERLAAQAPLGGGGRSARRCSSHPLTQYMFCSPGEGGVALVLCRGRPGPPLRHRPGVPAGRRASQSRPFGIVRGVQPVAGARAWSEPHRRRGERRRLRDGRDRPRRDGRGAGAGHRVGRGGHAHGRVRPLRGRRSRRR